MDALFVFGPLVLGIPLLLWFTLGAARGGGPVPRGKPPELRRGLVAAALVYGLYLFGAVGATGFALARDPAAAKSPGTLLLLDGAAKILALGIALPLLGRFDGARDPGPAHPVLSFHSGLLAGIAFLPLAQGVGILQEAAWRAAGEEMKPQSLVTFAQEGPEADFLLVLFFAVVLAPVFEELVFRVFLHSGLRGRIGPVPAALLSAALFSLSHGEAVALPVTFLLGLCLSFLRERTGGRSAPIAMHACYNAVQMAGILALRAGGGPPTGG